MAKVMFPFLRVMIWIFLISSPVRVRCDNCPPGCVCLGETIMCRGVDLDTLSFDTNNFEFMDMKKNYVTDPIRVKEHWSKENFPDLKVIDFRGVTNLTILCQSLKTFKEEFSKVTFFSDCSTPTPPPTPSPSAHEYALYVEAVIGAVSSAVVSLVLLIIGVIIGIRKIKRKYSLLLNEEETESNYSIESQAPKKGRNTKNKRKNRPSSLNTQEKEDTSSCALESSSGEENENISRRQKELNELQEAARIKKIRKMNKNKKTQTTCAVVAIRKAADGTFYESSNQNIQTPRVGMSTPFLGADADHSNLLDDPKNDLRFAFDNAQLELNYTPTNSDNEPYSA